MSPKVRTEDLLDAQDVAKILGLSHRESVTTYLRRYPDMPRPVVEIPKSKTRLWLRQEIVKWSRARRSSRASDG